MAETVAPALERRLKAERLGDVHCDRFTRGRYATDASHYQIMPIGVVVPRTIDDANRALAIAREERVPVTARGGGTSQAGQTVNSTLIVDCSKISIARSSRTACGSRSISPPPRARPSAVWSATMPAVRARYATAIRART
jgi:FAD/FMN-containing dehydrogenase